MRQSFLTSIISYAGVALGFVLTIWLYPSFFTTGQYGLTRVLLSLSMVLIQFSGLGIDSIIIRFFPFFRDEESNHHGFFPFILVIPLLGFVVFCLLFFFFKDTILSFYAGKTDLLLNYFSYLFPLALFILFFKTIERYTYALYKTVASTFLHEVFLRLLLIGILFGYFLGWISFQQFMMLFVLNYAIVLLLLIFYLSTISNISLRPDLTYLNKPRIKKILTYGAYSFFGNIATVIQGNIDILMLGAMAGLGNAGIYAIAFYVSSSIKIPSRSVQNISAPLISDAIKNKNFALVADIYKRSALNLLIVGGLLFCGIIANLHNLYSVLPTSFTSSSLVVITITFGIYFGFSTGLNGTIIINSQYYRFDLYITMAVILLNIILNYLLIPVYGILGAAIGTASADIFYNLVKVLYVWIKFAIHPFNKKMLPALIISGLLIYAALTIGYLNNPYIDTIIRMIAITIIYVGLVRFLNLSTDFNNLLNTIFNRIRKVNLKNVLKG